MSSMNPLSLGTYVACYNLQENQFNVQSEILFFVQIGRSVLLVCTMNKILAVFGHQVGFLVTIHIFATKLWLSEIVL